MFICVDFDGTCVTSEFPKVGKNIGAGPVLRYLAKNHMLILYTVRGDSDSKNSKQYTFLRDAIKWFKKNDVPLYGVNHNPGATISNSPKVHASLYIDDRGLGSPLVKTTAGKHIDWIRCVDCLHEIGLVKDDDIEELKHQVINDIDSSVSIIS